ncbi:MAG: 30S ribosomal protein S6 [Helicobacteraceae bacterium 4484_230]|nr:MAG: 30S ribosomal protein S6 [Helicobacteraceae bacterium 4484_230]
MRHYENLVIVKPTLTEEEIKNTIAAVEETLTSNGAEIKARDVMGMRKLAYPINKNERGFFQVIYYTMEPSAIAEVERRFRINEELLRFVTIKYDSKREVEAWNHLVEKTKKAAAPEAAEAPAAETSEAPAAEAAETPEAEAKTEEAPAAE